MNCPELEKRDAEIKRLKVQVAILQKVTKMTDSRLKAFFDAVIEIGEKLK